MIDIIETELSQVSKGFSIMGGLSLIHISEPTRRS